MTSIAITKDRLRQAIFDYIVQSRTGDDTLAYTTTAAMTADDVADSSTERLWDLLDNLQQDLYDDQPAQLLGTLGEEVVELPTLLSAVGAQFVVGEDLVAGQIATFDGDGRLVAFGDDVVQGIVLTDPPFTF